MIRCIPVSTCANCPHLAKNYGQFECKAFNYQALPHLKIANGIATPPPDWCPLPPHPSFAQAQTKGDA